MSLDLGTNSRRDYHLHRPLHVSTVYLPISPDHGLDRVVTPLMRLQSMRVINERAALSVDKVKDIVR